jgi:hypothetical protein
VSTLELSPELSAVLEENEQWRQFADWLPQERAAFRPPEKLGVSEWADRHRVLPTKNQARAARQRPGPRQRVDHRASRPLKKSRGLRAASSTPH